MMTEETDDLNPAMAGSRDATCNSVVAECGAGEREIQPSGSDAVGNRVESDAINLGLVMDVELNVALRFGQRQLTLREVLDLSSGSVVELDRQVEEPIELLLDGKVIARGEAVVIDGNYGLRVSEVPQPLAHSTAAVLRAVRSS